jgi:hypothetical protein
MIQSILIILGLAKFTKRFHETLPKHLNPFLQKERQKRRLWISDEQDSGNNCAQNGQAFAVTNIECRWVFCHDPVWGELK